MFHKQSSRDDLHVLLRCHIWPTLSFCRDCILPGIWRLGFTEHFHVPVWVSAHCSSPGHIHCTMSSILFFLFPSCLLSFLGVFLIARNRPKIKQQDRNFIAMDKIPGECKICPLYDMLPYVMTVVHRLADRNWIQCSGAEPGFTLLPLSAAASI